MKTFAGTFFAILVTVMFAFVEAKSHLDKWTDAKMRCVAEISSAYEPDTDSVPGEIERAPTQTPSTSTRR